MNDPLETAECIRSDRWISDRREQLQEHGLELFHLEALQGPGPFIKNPQVWLVLRVQLPIEDGMGRVVKSDTESWNPMERSLDGNRGEGSHEGRDRRKD